MKKIILATVNLLSVIILLTSCGSSSSKSSNTNNNNTPTNYMANPYQNNCLNGQVNCSGNFSQYNYSNYGLIPYPINFYYYGGIQAYWQYRGINQGNFCECPSGYQPVFNQHVGIACMKIQSVNYYNYSGGGYYYQGQWINYPQNYYNNQNCYSQIATSCFVDQQMCGAGSYCRPTGNGSRFGICVNNNTNGYYNYYGNGGSGYR